MFSMASPLLLHLHSQGPQPDPPPPPPPPHGSNPVSPFYYVFAVTGLLIVVIAIFFLLRTFFRAIYNLIVGLREANTSQTVEEFDINLVSSTFIYRKEETESTGHEQDNDPCVVCLSSFEEGDEVRQLVQCKHSFHASCVDTWLHSHSDCPLCRAVIRPDRPSVSGSSRNLLPSEIYSV